MGGQFSGQLWSRNIVWVEGGRWGGGRFLGQHLTFAEHISSFQFRVSFGVNIEHLGATLKEQDNPKKIHHSV